MIIRDVAVSAVGDLALRPPRAALAAIVDGGIGVYPVSVTLEAPADPASSARIVAVPEGTADLAGGEVVVIADDGPEWFRLRSLTIRGIADAVGDRTYRVAPTGSVAWNYGALREVPTPPGPSAPQHASLSLIDQTDDLRPCYPPNLEAAVRRSRVMILASCSRRGRPFAVPLWLVAHHGRLFTTTAAASWTVRNVSANPQVAVLLGGERPGDAERVVVHGRARALRGMPAPAVLGRLAWRYCLQPQFAAVELQHLGLWGRRVRYYRQAQPAHIVITPQTVTEYHAPEWNRHASTDRP